MKVLVVDDEPFNLELLMEVLSVEGFEVITASDGVEAVEVFQREKPDAVLMDIRMPRMNGVEAMQRIRELPGGKEVPILCLTASGLGRDRDRFLAEGFDGYLQKPIDPWSVAEQLRAAAQRSRKNGSHPTR